MACEVYFWLFFYKVQKPKVMLKIHFLKFKLKKPLKCYTICEVFDIYSIIDDLLLIKFNKSACR